MMPPWGVCLTCRVIAPTAGFLEFRKAKAWPCAAKSPRERYLLRVRWRSYSAPDHNQSSTVPNAVGYHPEHDEKYQAESLRALRGDLLRWINIHLSQHHCRHGS